jgi:hypothetical protein
MKGYNITFMSHDHSHQAAPPRAESFDSASAFAVSAGLRLSLALAAAAILWLAVSWALEWL